jgi:tRNA pseudouridine(38-40) synthase
MRNIRLLLEYDGTHFHGWQFQPGFRTIQGEIQNALKKIFNNIRLRIGDGNSCIDKSIHKDEWCGAITTLNQGTHGRIVDKTIFTDYR